MDKKVAEQKIKQLTQQINHYNQAYFQHAQSLISDYAFDQLLEQLNKLETQFPELKKQNSPTQRIGEALSKNFPTIKHKYPMRSLANSYAIQQVKDFVQRTHKLLPNKTITFFCELKIDGIAVSLHYHQGTLQKIVTRGDGTQGDDITRNLHTIQDLPHTLPSSHPHIEVRGEVFMTKTNFHALNQQHKKHNKPPLANPRNTVAGTLKTLDPSLIAHRKLHFYPYALPTHTPTHTTQQHCMQTLAQWGFNTLPHTSQHCQDINQIIQYIHYWNKKKHTLDIDIDGIVIKVNNLQHQHSMGNTAKSPRWAIAYKYQPESATTLLQNVTYQVGRTGVITPVAHLQPTPLAGTIVKRASLYNITTLQRLNLHIGDTVTIEKKGDIIPKITSINTAKRPPNAQPITLHNQCPSCATPLVQKQSLHYCPNHHQCPEQLKATLTHFASRQALNLRHLGPKIINLLFQHKLITKPADLYHLTANHLQNLEGFQQKSIQNLLQSIATTKQQPFHKVLFALGIPHVGATVARKLATYFKDIQHLMQASQQDLMTIPEIGPEIALSLTNYLRHDINKNHINRLRHLGLTLTQPTTTTQAPQTLAQKTLVISGTFDTFSREDIRTYIHHHGGRLVSAISTHVHYLVAGHSPGAKKIKQAQQLNIQIITEHTLRQIVNT